MYGLLKSQNTNIKNKKGNEDVSVLTLPQKQTRNSGVDIYLGVPKHSSQQGIQLPSILFSGAICWFSAEVASLYQNWAG